VIRARADAKGTRVATLIHDATLAQLKYSLAFDEPTTTQELRTDLRVLEQAIDRTEAKIDLISEIVRELLHERNPEALTRILSKHPSK
jgi:hypothetical protein